MIEIQKMADGQYRIFHGADQLTFDGEKFEDLYYAVPTANTQFFRLILDNIARDQAERELVHKMFKEAGDSRENLLTVLQEAIQAMPEPEENSE